MGRGGENTHGIPQRTHGQILARCDKGQLERELLGRRQELRVGCYGLEPRFWPGIPRIPQVDLDSITMRELAQIKRLCAVYADGLADLGTAEECCAYAEAALDAARIVGTGI